MPKMSHVVRYIIFFCKNQNFGHLALLVFKKYVSKAISVIGRGGP
jgi:hypothetical protein